MDSRKDALSNLQRKALAAAIDLALDRLKEERAFKELFTEAAVFSNMFNNGDGYDQRLAAEALAALVIEIMLRVLASR